MSLVLSDQKEILFQRYADIEGGAYISTNRVKNLLGLGPVRYAKNICRGQKDEKLYYFMYGNTEVLTRKGFLEATSYFLSTEIMKGRCNLMQLATTDYLIDHKLGGRITRRVPHTTGWNVVKGGRGNRTNEKTEEIKNAPASGANTGGSRYNPTNHEIEGTRAL